MSLNVTENDWHCPRIARDNPEPDSDDVVAQTMAFNMGRFEEVFFPLNYCFMRDFYYFKHAYRVHFAALA